MDSKRLERIEEKIDETNEKLSSIDKTLVAQHASLNEHMRRTELLEDAMKPITIHVAMVNGVVKFLKFLAALTALVELYRFFK